ncbi:MAG: hypothetical protein H6509_07280 [Bryobacterales bacterium]|nr:hypothetical protein [Acidobacteriota bacterium]MCB9384401.1 hypothetical protein [Bryobacterales bacterium]
MRTRFLLLLLLSIPLAAADDPLEKGRALYDAAREAAGGGKALRDISFERVTELQQQDRTIQIHSSVKIVLPDASRTEIETPGGRTVLVYSGGKVRNLTNGQALPQAAADLQRRELARTFALFGPEPAQGTVRYRGEEQVDGRPTQVIELFDIGDTPLRLFLDAETHDVLKRMYVGDAPDGTMAQVEEYLSDYRAVDGFRWAQHTRTVRNGNAGPTSSLGAIVVNQGLTYADLEK